MDMEHHKFNIKKTVHQASLTTQSYSIIVKRCNKYVKKLNFEDQNFPLRSKLKRIKCLHQFENLSTDCQRTFTRTLYLLQHKRKSMEKLPSFIWNRNLTPEFIHDLTIQLVKTFYNIKHLSLFQPTGVMVPNAGTGVSTATDQINNKLGFVPLNLTEIHNKIRSLPNLKTLNINLTRRLNKPEHRLLSKLNSSKMMLSSLKTLNIQTLGFCFTPSSCRRFLSYKNILNNITHLTVSINDVSHLLDFLSNAFPNLTRILSLSLPTQTSHDILAGSLDIQYARFFTSLVKVTILKRLQLTVLDLPSFIKNFNVLSTINQLELDFKLTFVEQLNILNIDADTCNSILAGQQPSPLSNNEDFQSLCNKLGQLTELDSVCMTIRKDQIISSLCFIAPLIKSLKALPNFNIKVEKPLIFYHKRQEGLINFCSILSLIDHLMPGLKSLGFTIIKSSSESKPLVLLDSRQLSKFESLPAIKFSHIRVTAETIPSLEKILQLVRWNPKIKTNEFDVCIDTISIDTKETLSLLIKSLKRLMRPQPLKVHFELDLMNLDSNDVIKEFLQSVFNKSGSEVTWEISLTIVVRMTESERDKLIQDNCMTLQRVFKQLTVKIWIKGLKFYTIICNYGEEVRKGELVYY